MNPLKTLRLLTATRLPGGGNAKACFKSATAHVRAVTEPLIHKVAVVLCEEEP